MAPDDVESKLLAALAVALAPRAGVGSVSTARLLEVAAESFDLAAEEALHALDRLAERGRLVERLGEWSLRRGPLPAR